MTGFADPIDDFYEQVPGARSFDAELTARVERGARRPLSNDEILRLFQADITPGKVVVVAPDGHGDFDLVEVGELAAFRDPSIDDR